MPSQRKKNLCDYEECSKTNQVFDTSDETIDCIEHEKKVVKVKGKHCAEDGCDLIPSFNLAGKKALYCSKHQKEYITDKVTV